jgi:hypothetical protein
MTFASLAHRLDVPPTTIPQPDVATLLSMMGKGPSTSQWDIVCSYSLDQLNAMLARVYDSQSKGVARELTLQTPPRPDPLTGQQFFISYDITLGPPRLEFMAGINGQCLLTMPLLKGRYTITPVGGSAGAPNLIPENKYSVLVQVPLICIYGDAQDKAESGSVIAFPQGNVSQAHITLHIKTTQTTSWSITPLPGSNPDVLETYFLPVLHQYFQNNIRDIDYALAGLTNELPVGNDIVIKPQSFAFVTAGEGDSGVLSLYIQTANSNNAPGQFNPSFRPGNAPTLPVPKGYHASLIFSRDFLQKVYLLPQLAAAGFLRLKAAVDPVGTGDVGCRVYGNYNTKKTIDKSFVDLGTTEVDFDPLTLDLTRPDNAFSFHFMASKLEVNMSAHASVDWKSSTVSSQGPVFGPEGTARAIVSLTKDFELSQIGVVTDERMDLSFSVSPNDYEVSIHPGTSDSCWNGGIASKVRNGVRERIGSIVPSLSFNFAGINFFKTTNLLFPNQQVLAFDATQGIHTPCDLLLLANLA